MFQRTVHLSKTNLAYVAKLARARARVARWKTAYRAVHDELERIRKTDGKEKLIKQPSRPTSSHRPLSANMSPPCSPPLSTSFPALHSDETRPSTHDGVLEESKTPSHTRRRVHDVHSRNQSLSLPPGAVALVASSTSSSRARSVDGDVWDGDVMLTRAEEEAIIEQAMTHVEQEDKESDEEETPETRRIHATPRHIIRTPQKRPATRDKTKTRDESKQEIRPATTDGKHNMSPPPSARLVDLARPRLTTPNIRAVDDPTSTRITPNPYAMVSREYETKIHTLIKQQHMQYAFTHPHTQAAPANTTSPRPKVHQLNALRTPSSQTARAAVSSTPPVVRRSQAMTQSQQQRQQQQQQLLQQLKLNQLQPLQRHTRRKAARRKKGDVSSTAETQDVTAAIDAYPEYRKDVMDDDEGEGEDKEETQMYSTLPQEQDHQLQSDATDSSQQHVQPASVDMSEEIGELEEMGDPLADDTIGDAKVESISTS